MRAKVTFDTNNKQFMNTDVSDLELPARAEHSLKRAGLWKVSDIINNYDNLDDTMVDAPSFGAAGLAALTSALLRRYMECLSPQRLVVFLAELNDQGVPIKLNDDTKEAFSCG